MREIGPSPGIYVGQSCPRMATTARADPAFGLGLLDILADVCLRHRVCRDESSASPRLGFRYRFEAEEGLSRFRLRPLRQPSEHKSRCRSLFSTTKNAAMTPQINKRNRLPLSALRCHRVRLSTTILAPFLAVVVFCPVAIGTPRTAETARTIWRAPTKILRRDTPAPRLATRLASFAPRWHDPCSLGRSGRIDSPYPRGP